MTSQAPEHVRSRDFRSQASLRPTSVQIGSDDPSIIEEAQNLLSQFMRHSSHETQGSQSGNRATSQKVSNSRIEHSSGSVDDPQVVYVISDDSALESAPENYTVPSARRRHSVRHPRLRSSRTTPGLGSFSKSPGNDSETDSVLPPAREKYTNNSNLDRQTTYSPNFLSARKSPVKNNDKAPRTRRSARSRTGPINYYKKLNLSSFESEEEHSGNEDDDSLANSDQPQQRHDCSRSCDLSTPPCYRDSQLIDHMQYSVIYHSSRVQILKSPFKTLDDFKGVAHARYRPERNPADYAKGLREEDLASDSILHFDFDLKEMTAVLNLLSFSECQWRSAPDIALTDQLIQVASTYNIHPKFFKKISSILKLSRLLSTEDVSDGNALLLEMLASTPCTKELRRARRIAMRLLGSQEKQRTEGSSTPGNQRGHKVEELRRLSGYLSFASALGRRQCADIEAFIVDAKKGHLPTVPSVIKAVKLEDGSLATRKNSQASGNLNKLLQDRELGCAVSRQISSRVLSNLGLSRTWKGASNDVIVLAWSPDGTKFAAGATAQCDEHNMEYNRGNNLILGDLITDSLEELPDHWSPRPPGFSRGTMNDHRLFMSVTACEWFDDTLYTASYDKTVKLWRFPNHRASCYKTLDHDSKVQVMARSNLAKNVLATGTQSVGFWQLDESTYNVLDLPRQRSKREIDLIPTSLAWGTIPITREILIAGMSEKGDGVTHNGLLAAWHIAEASSTPIQLSPNSQNIFDVKWHPCLPLFATASSAKGGGTTLLSSKSTRSVVRLYSPLISKMRTMELECPALDINDVTFCPGNSNYVTASCTDGITYVWDTRNPDTILHKLHHGEPLNQIDETLPREQADVGVRLALWGNSVTQFYTGASDGILKTWNVLRSPDDALVQDVASFGEEIMSGAFSPDRSNLLIGDAAGGLHLLSPNTFADETLPFKFKRASEDPFFENDPDSGSGIMAARKAILDGHLSRHPIYGVGQGPRYNGPYAAWARPDNTPRHQLGQTKLKEEWQLRQLDGVPPALRPGLNDQLRREVECQRQLAQIRNGQHVNKRKRLEPGHYTKSRGALDDLCSDDGFWAAPVKPKRLAAEPKHAIIENANIEIIDLTGDSDTEYAKPPKDSLAFPTTQGAESYSGVGHPLEGFEGILEDDHWWPSSDQIDPNFHDADV
ncbi:WD40-repeat-containing domain protein [Aspergillus caelatus]|uniref:WD40-repeat-containing domain protein n=1 Tax=Aspergillus caelatus TaxID=61420 RepID=A0A5N7AC19_9EURO|nr:WD40-repeat-containing domain protein [Aspergillus caelatus]KAE8367437.1 WD40-repeat-containing domain protein [Aspergillus caelatus]